MATQDSEKGSERVLEGSIDRTVAARPERVFAVITDLDGLPSWNERIIGVAATPDRLEPGATWTVRVKVLGNEFDSVSHVVTHDPQRRVFEHRSKPDMDNPSFTVWRWQVDPDGDGSRVTLSWALHALTPSRRFLLSPMRNRMIRRTEAPASLAALAARCTEAHAESQGVDA